MNFGSNFDSDTRDIREIKRRINNINFSIICLSVLVFITLYKDYQLHALFTTIMTSLAKELTCIKKEMNPIVV
jgi:hypothetical protein